MGCSEDFLGEYCPDENGDQWLEEKVKELEKTDLSYEVYSYTYKGEPVFLINPCTRNCADMITNVYNCQGEVICSFGGFAGMNTCPDFDTATKGKLLYSGD